MKNRRSFLEECLKSFSCLAHDVFIKEYIYLLELEIEKSGLVYD